MSVRDAAATHTMHAVRLTSPGGPEALELRGIPVPEPGPDEIRVRVRAAALTRGELVWPTGRLPATPSYELAGVVDALGPGVSGVAPGEEVWALTPFNRDGCAAELAIVPATLLAPRPTGVGAAACAAVPLPALSAWQALFDRGGLAPGQRVVVNGAGGGVGRYAVQLARWRGAHVIGTASAAGLEAAREAGADELVDRSEPGWTAAVGPADLVFDTVGGEALAASRVLLAPGGRIVSVAEEPPAGLEATYFVVTPDAEQLRELGVLLKAGTIVPAVDSVFPLERAQEAFVRLERRGKHGKVVLEVAGD